MIEGIGVIIPSYERHPFLERQLDWLKGIGIGEVVAVDGSLSALPSGRRWGTWYHHLPNESFVARLRFGIERIKSPIVTICADDDYLSPDGLARAAEFLLANHRFSTAFGQYVGLRYKNSDWDLRVLYGKSRGFSIDANSRTKRLALWMRNYMHSFYSPHRLEQMRPVIRALPTQDGAEFPTEAEAANLVELSVAISDVWFGGRMVFPRQLYMVRQAVARRTNIPSPDWVETHRPTQFRNWVRAFSSQFALEVGANEEEVEALWMKGYRFHRDWFVEVQRKGRKRLIARLKSVVPPTVRSMVRRYIPALERSAKKRIALLAQLSHDSRLSEISAHIARFALTLPAEATSKVEHSTSARSK